MIHNTYPQLSDPMFVETYDFGDCWTRVHPEAAFEELDVAVAIVSTRANFSEMAKLLGRSRSSIRNHVERNQPLRDLMQETWETFLDEVEGLHQSAALTGDLGVQRFFLQTKGKDRGYVTRSEATGKDGEPLAPTVDFSKMSTEALQELMKARESATSQ